MQFRTSCFNGSVLKNQLRRFWPLPVVVLGTVILVLLLPLMGELQRYGRSGQWTDGLLSTVYGTGQIMLWLMLFAAFLSAALVFHHIHSRKEIQFYFDLPLTRRCMYATSWVSGFLMIAAPMAVGIGLTMAVSLVMGGSVLLLPLLKLYGVGIALLLIFYSMAAMSCVLAGQTFGALLLYGGMHAALYVVVSGASEIAGLFMPGVQLAGVLETVTECLTPVMKLVNACGTKYVELPADAVQGIPSVTVTDSMGNTTVSVAAGFRQPGVIAIYGIVGAVLAALGGVIYQKRPAEKAGETVAFRWVSAAVKVYGALIITVGGCVLTMQTGLFQEKIPFLAVVAVVLLFAAVGYLAAEMVVSKTLRVFDKLTLRGCGILLGALLLLMGVGRMDLFGTVGWIPDYSTVEKAIVSYNYSNDVEVDPEDAVALQQTVLENRDYLTNNSYHATSHLSIYYFTEDGSVTERRYLLYHAGNLGDVLRTDPIMAQTYELMRQPEYNRRSWFAGFEDGVTEETFVHGYISTQWTTRQLEKEGLGDGFYLAFDNDYTDSHTRDLEAEEAAALYEAILRDIDAGNMDPNGLETRTDDMYAGSIDFECYAQAYSPEFGTYQEYLKEVLWQYNAVPVYTDMEHTLACLEELGVHLKRA